MEETFLVRFLPVDYSDTYRREFSPEKELQAEELLQTLFTRFPWWVDALMKLRNRLVKPLGLKGDGFEEHFAEMILHRSDREIVWGMDDKHLCFYVSVGCSEWEEGKQTASITTLVKYHNCSGKVYFFFIKPFHKIIIKSLLKKALRTPDNQNKR